MLKFFRRYFNELILPICLIIGLIRRKQIESYQLSIHKPTMAGMFAMYSYIVIGTCLTVVAIVLRSSNYPSKLISNTAKVIFKIAVLITELILICFTLIFFGY